MRKLTAPLTGNLLYEHRTITAMTQMYCAYHHPQASKSEGLCESCKEFIDFAAFRLSKCPYGQVKPVCQSCPIHCYNKEMKDKARAVMVFSGPRMLLKHPIMAIRHLWHARKPIPERPRKNQKNNSTQ